MIEPTWTGHGDTFWYRRDLEEGGHEYVLVDPESGERRPLFDHEELASRLGVLLGEEVAADNLPIMDYQVAGDNAVHVRLATGRMVSVNGGSAIELASSGSGVLPSHDGKQELFLRDHNLWLRDTKERALTTDGEAFCAWGALIDNSMVHIPMKKLGAILPPVFTGFSPSGRLVVTVRVDERHATEWPLVEHLPAEGARPQVHAIRVVLEDELEQGHPELALIDLTTGARTTIPLTREMVAGFVLTGIDALTWSSDEQYVFLFVHAVGSATASLLEIEVATGAQRVVVTETDEPIYEPNTHLYAMPLIHVLVESREVIWFSQRDGWGHLYLYDLDSGRCKNVITAGNLVVSDLLHVDAARREVLLLAGCGDNGDNPYWRKLFRASLDGGAQALLTREPCHHELATPEPYFLSLFSGGLPSRVSSISPSGRFFVDHMSTTSRPPEIVLRDTSDGRIVVTLERTDITALLAAGYRPPEQFCVKAEDGVTDVWGVITMPSDVGPGASVPVVDLMYAGFQVASQPSGFLRDGLGPATGAPGYGALGFASVILDGRGTPGRDKTFRQWTHGHPDTTRGLEDHVAAITALKETYPTLDLDRVGVTGHSYGGYNSARAMFLFPDFFKVAVSSAGVHAPEKSPKGSWAWHVGAETAHDSDLYQALGNPHLAHRLEGRLLLVFGELDENATLDHSLALAEGLIEGGKRFDMLLIPGLDHYRASPYRTMATWDYFVEHLLGAEPPAEYVPE